MTTTLVASPSPGSVPPWVRLEFTTDAPGATHVVLRRVQDGNSALVSRVPVVPGPATHVYNDHSILMNLPVVYSAAAVDAGGVVLERSPTTSAVTVAGTSAWLVDTAVPALSVPIRIVGKEGGDSGSTARAALLEPLGRRTPIAVTDVRSGASGTTIILTATHLDERRMREILASGRSLLFTGPKDFDLLYPLRFTAGAVGVARVSEALDEHRLFTIGWVEVDPPDGGAGGNTWDWYVSQGRRWVEWVVPGKLWQDIVGGAGKRLVAP